MSERLAGRRRHQHDKSEAADRHNLSVDPQMLEWGYIIENTAALVHHDTHVWDTEDPDADTVLLRTVRPFLARLDGFERAALELVVMGGLSDREASRRYAADRVLREPAVLAAVAAVLRVPVGTLTMGELMDAAQLVQYPPAAPRPRACGDDRRAAEYAAACDEHAERTAQRAALIPLLEVPYVKQMERAASNALKKLRKELAGVPWVRALARGTDLDDVPAPASVLAPTGGAGTAVPTPLLDRLRANDAA